MSGDVATLTEIGRLDLRTSRSGDTATASLLRALGLQYRYQPARLAIAKSLSLPTRPQLVENLDGKSIRGETLFGQAAADLGMWISLLSAHSGCDSLSRKDLHELVAAHWARGAGLLWDALRASDDPVGTLASQMIARR
jgi:hypothetical protein